MGLPVMFSRPLQHCISPVSGDLKMDDLLEHSIGSKPVVVRE